MTALRRHRRLALLPAMLWLAVQLAMAAGLTIATPAAAAKPPPADLAPLVAGLDPVHWLCGPGSEADAADTAADHAASGHCLWCQGFGALPDLASRPEALPPFAAPGLRNQPFAHAAPPGANGPITGFRSRAPPL